MQCTLMNAGVSMTCSICPHLFQGTGLLQGCSRLSGMQKGRKDRAAICGFSDTVVCVLLLASSQYL